MITAVQANQIINASRPGLSAHHVRCFPIVLVGALPQTPAGSLFRRRHGGYRVRGFARTWRIPSHENRQRELDRVSWLMHVTYQKSCASSPASGVGWEPNMLLNSITLPYGAALPLANARSTRCLDSASNVSTWSGNLMAAHRPIRRLANVADPYNFAKSESLKAWVLYVLNISPRCHNILGKKRLKIVHGRCYIAHLEIVLPC
jgi:hypothetical protein